ncbi:MAG: tRNA (adenosine(37)-N6)-threonylcarbamoyltransferase complex dimerization subunit type 1 TsaB [Nitrospirae bacterium]|nr:tRNA (adenosine(37)-N6)-threonylcarbamoyltransferase complex dimerization subunit type 1 TsaB [Nitrospirota bacterium]
MTVLAIETSTRLGAVALINGNELIAEARFCLQTGHSARLMSSIDMILGNSGLSMRDVHAIAVSIGPGSFTGLRVGLGTAKGLSFSSGIPIWPVSTLEALAFPFAHSSMPVCPVVEARKNEVYAALYQPVNGEFRTILDECAMTPDELAASLNGPVLLMGDGAAKYRSIFESSIGGNAHFAPGVLSVASAVWVGAIALRRFAASPAPNAATLAPRYIKASEAEVRWKKQK